MSVLWLSSKPVETCESHPHGCGPGFRGKYSCTHKSHWILRQSLHPRCVYTARSQPTHLGLCWYEEARPSQCSALGRLDHGLKSSQGPGTGRSSLGSEASNIHLSVHHLPSYPLSYPFVHPSSTRPSIYPSCTHSSILHQSSHHAFVYSSSTHLSTHTRSTHSPSRLHPFTHNLHPSFA